MLYVISTLIASVLGASIGFCATRAFVNLAGRDSEAMRTIFKGAEYADALIAFVVTIAAAAIFSKDYEPTMLATVLVPSIAALIGALILPIAFSAFFGIRSLLNRLGSAVDHLTLPQAE